MLPRFRDEVRAGRERLEQLHGRAEQINKEVNCLRVKSGNIYHAFCPRSIATGRANIKWQRSVSRVREAKMPYLTR